MLKSNRTANKSYYSSQASDYTNHQVEFDKIRQSRGNDNIKKLGDPPKVQFRKVLKQRTKHSRVGEHDELQEKSIISNRSSRYLERAVTELQTKEEDKRKILQDNKFSFRNVSLSEERSQQKNDFGYQAKSHLNERPKKYYQKDLIMNSNLEDLHDKLSRPGSSLPKRDLLNSSRSNQNYKNLFQDNSQLNSKNKQLQKSPENGQLDKKSFRPKSSLSNFSPIQNLKTAKLRKISQLSDFDKDLQQKNDAKTKQMKVLIDFDNLVEQFLSIEQKISRLIENKWYFIEQKLMKEKSESKVTNSKSILSTKHKQSIAFQSINQPKQINKNPNQKFSFSRAIIQKNIDNEIMTQIKSLRSLNLSSLQFSKDKNKDLFEILQQMQQRRSQIIQKALAQSMVESQLLKKYYSGQNSKGLSTSNHKVGQTNSKSKIMLAKIKKIEGQKGSTIDHCQQRPSEHRNSLSKQSQSKSNFVPPGLEDYEKYRYQHPQFKANLQPLPRSSYKSQFFNYSNIQIFNPKYKQNQNMVFPTTSAIKTSSYRNQYKQFSPQRINYKELDAYQDKFKQIDIDYMPKKRSQSQACTTRKTSKVNKYVNQLDYVKRLKTESLLNNSLGKQITQKLASRFFATESKNEFQNPQKMDNRFDKSQIKHKNLHMLKYDMKKKFRV